MTGVQGQSLKRPLVRHNEVKVRKNKDQCKHYTRRRRLNNVQNYDKEQDVWTTYTYNTDTGKEVSGRHRP